MRRLFKLAAIAALSVMLVAMPTGASAHADVNAGWVKNYSSGYLHWVKVCPPFGATGWDKTITKHKRVDDVLVAYNNLNTSVHYQEVGTACRTLFTNHDPFVHVVYDDGDCISTGIFSCDIGAPMATYVEKVTEFSSAADTWSSDGSGDCADPTTGSTQCILWAEVVVDRAQRDPASSSGFYWGTDPDINFNHDYVTSLGELMHEFGHTVGLPHLCRSAVGSTQCAGIIDPQCDDFTYPNSSNAIMCEVIEHKEWNTTLKAHDSNAIFAVY